MALQQLPFQKYREETLDQHENTLFSMIQAIRISVSTLPDHPDTNAVESCWNFLEADIRDLYETIRQLQLTRTTNESQSH